MKHFRNPSSQIGGVRQCMQRCMQSSKHRPEIPHECHEQDDQIGRIFAYWAIGHFLNYKRSPNFVTADFKCQSCVSILTKNGLRYILGDFFTNSSGHPGWQFGWGLTDGICIWCHGGMSPDRMPTGRMSTDWMSLLQYPTQCHPAECHPSQCHLRQNVTYGGMSPMFITLVPKLGDERPELFPMVRLG
jgi:hypothetical protein